MTLTTFVFNTIVPINNRLFFSLLVCSFVHFFNNTPFNSMSITVFSILSLLVNVKKTIKEGNVCHYDHWNYRLYIIELCCMRYIAQRIFYHNLGIKIEVRQRMDMRLGDETPFVPHS